MYYNNQISARFNSATEDALQMNIAHIVEATYSWTPNLSETKPHIDTLHILGFALYGCSNEHAVKTLNYEKEKPLRGDREGAGFALRMDLGATKPVIGQMSTNALMNTQVRTSMPMYKLDRSFRFSDDTVKSRGNIELYLKTPTHIFDIPVVFDVEPVDVLDLVGPDVLDAYELFADTVHKRLVNACENAMHQE